MRDPDMVGSDRAAWKVRAPERLLRPDHAGSLSQWVIHLGQTPVPWWQVGVVHLRPIPGVRPAMKHYAQAEYEFLIIKFNPDNPLSGQPDIGLIEAGVEWTTPKPQFLARPEACVHFHGVTDEQARSIGDGAVRLIVESGTGPDDYRWRSYVANAVVDMNGKLGPTGDGQPEGQHRRRGGMR